MDPREVVFSVGKLGPTLERTAHSIDYKRDRLDIALALARQTLVATMRTIRAGVTSSELRRDRIARIDWLTCCATEG